MKSVQPLSKVNLWAAHIILDKLVLWTSTSINNISIPEVDESLFLSLLHFNVHSLATFE